MFLCFVFPCFRAYNKANVSSHWYASSSSCAKRGSPALASAAALAALADCGDDIDRSAIEPQVARLQVGLQLAAAELCRVNLSNSRAASSEQRAG